jgi:hypothetical protein
MHDRDDLKPGTRVRLTSLGMDRCPRLKSRTGVIVAASKQSQSFRVLIDGRKMPLALHASYIEAEQG